MTFELPATTPIPERATLVSSVLSIRGTPFEDLGELRADLVTYDSFGPDLFDQDVGVNAMSLVAHPGFTNSDLQNTTQDHGGAGVLGWFSQKSAKAGGMAPAKGALPALRAATDPNASGGTLYGPRFNSFGAAVRRPTLRSGIDKVAAQLWEISARETGLEIELAPTG